MSIEISSSQPKEVPAAVPNSPPKEISAAVPSSPLKEVSAAVPSSPPKEISAVTPSSPPKEISAVTPSSPPKEEDSPKKTDAAAAVELVAEKLLGKRNTENGIEYLAKWAGRDNSTADSWEPESSLHCKELIAEYEATLVEHVPQNEEDSGRDKEAAEEVQTGDKPKVEPKDNNASFDLIRAKGEEKELIVLEPAEKDANSAANEEEPMNLNKRGLPKRRSATTKRRIYGMSAAQSKKSNTPGEAVNSGKKRKSSAGSSNKKAVEKSNPISISPGQYEVEKIIGRRKEGSVIQYQIKWKGYDEITWEPIGNLHCTDLVKSYDAKEKSTERDRSKPNEDGCSTPKTTSRKRSAQINKEGGTRPKKVRFEEGAVSDSSVQPVKVIGVERNLEQGQRPIAQVAYSDASEKYVPTSVLVKEAPEILVDYYEERLNLTD